MQDTLSPNIMRRLTAAEGYLELAMPGYALEELESIEDAGPFQAIVDFMMGESLKSQERYGDAIAALRRAVQTMPPPHNQRVLRTLNECLQLGDVEEADETSWPDR